ncbi:transporter [Streptomyces sp. M41(2017)]|uniref:transporter n=1 Tax=Streptomyces sp. M41(2017) TaxID=1955065 RepID=UPI0009BFEAF6|nr:transporter [Streptomyces sp. M41(2017)]OQQ17490.1 transporter [Streptomyces sp. M41(2017)]
MSNLKVFRVRGGQATEVSGAAVRVEVELQRLIEANMEAMLGVRCLATEYRTGHHGGRIDSLGLDENGTPVIVEYKRNRDQNVISQGLSYLWWLHDHHHEFEGLTREKLGDQAAADIDWSAPRIVCVAGAFTRHDTVAVEMIGHRIDLVTYRVFEDVLTLQLIASAGGSRTSARGRASGSPSAASASPKSVQQFLDESPDDLKELYAGLDELLISHRDVFKEPQLLYVAYRRIVNVATVRVQPRNRLLVVNLRLNPETVELKEGFSRDMRGLGALGIRHGVEVRIGSREQRLRIIDRSR